LPPYTKLPKPEGFINFSYSPMSPPNWGIAPFEIHVFVYSNVRIALQALLQAATTIQAQRLERGSAQLFNDHLFFRGQADVTHRILPTRLRGPWHEPPARQRFSTGASTPEARDHWGEWYEDVEPSRQIEDSVSEIELELLRRDALERAAIERASQVPEVATLDPFQKRAAIRHYSRVFSPLLDLSTKPEVAAFFATGGASTAPRAGQIGMLWAIDLNHLADLFSVKTVTIVGGEKTIMTPQPDKWGVNKQMFEEFGVEPTRLELASVELPFLRPQAQHARFFSLAGEEGSTLPPKSDLTWWSIIERTSYACAFIHDGSTYENPDHNITAAALWPENETLAITLAEVSKAG
jgi:hypothetical protein